MEFRHKKPPRFLDEIEALRARYGVRRFRAVDNIMSPSFFEEVLPQLAKMSPAPEFIYEVKANLRKRQIESLGEARVSVQIGIESLSTNVLRLMRKGTTSLRNIQTLKWCKQNRVLADWNLIWGFPGEGPEDYRRLLDLARMLTHLDPPTGVGPIRLDRFSPNFNDADQLGFRDVRPMKYLRYSYPFDESTMQDLVYYFDFDYKEDIDDGGFKAPLHEAIWRWKNGRDQLFAQRENGLVSRVLRSDQEHEGDHEDGWEDRRGEERDKECRSGSRGVRG
jgi:hypothetical protein